MNNVYYSPNSSFSLLKGDVNEVLPKLEKKFDMVFADPPYFLSNDGLSVSNGKVVSVNKGDWDRGAGFAFMHSFNTKWITSVRERMKDNATIWISGTMHNIFNIGQVLQELDFKILNTVVWEKSNPPPNFSCRYFTHSTEMIIWARKNKKGTHYFNYELMKRINGGRQMKDVWGFPAIARWEKTCGKHPTQKPIPLLSRIILASSKKRDEILDPFTGSSTTGIAASLLERNFVGIDKEEEFLNLSKQRYLEIENPSIARAYKARIKDFPVFT